MNKVQMAAMGGVARRIAVAAVVFVMALLAVMAGPGRSFAENSGNSGDGRVPPGWKVFSDGDLSVAAPQDWFVAVYSDQRLIRIMPFAHFDQYVLVAIQDAGEESQAVLAKQRADRLQSERPKKVNFWHQYDFAEEVSLSRTIMFKRDNKVLAYKRSGNADEIAEMPEVLSTLDSARPEERAMLEILKNDVLPVAEKYVPAEVPYLVFDEDTDVTGSGLGFALPKGWICRFMQVPPYDKVIYSPEMDLRIGLAFHISDMSVAEKAEQYSQHMTTGPEKYGPGYVLRKEDLLGSEHLYILGTDGGKMVIMAVWGNVAGNAAKVREIVASFHSDDEDANAILETLKTIELIGLK